MYRSIDADTWSDPWFSELSPPAKLVFLYLITNHHTNAAGLCEVTLRVISFETGLDADQLQRILVKLAPRVMWWQEYSLIWVRNFYRRQRANTNGENFRKAAARIAQDAPVEVRDAIIAQYPDLGLPAPPPPKKDRDRDASTASRMDGDASPESVDALASHTNGIPIPSPSLTHPIRNRTVSEPVPETEQNRTGRHASRAASPRQEATRAIFAALLDVCGYEPDARLTRTERGKVNAAVKEIADAGGDAEEITRRAIRYRAKYADAALTPSAIAGHWGELAAEPKPRGKIVQLRPATASPHAEAALERYAAFRRELSTFGFPPEGPVGERFTAEFGVAYEQVLGDDDYGRVLRFVRERLGIPESEAADGG